jgi:hypothetical protein
MITHFAEIHLQTLSPIGVRQVYHEALGFSVISQTDNDIRIAITPHTVFQFTRTQEPVRPAHLAFEVRHSTFHKTADLLACSHVPLCGDLETESTHQRYFKDGDGNLLEVYSHGYVGEDILATDNPLGVLYVREVGFVVEDVMGFWDWLADTFDTIQTKGKREGLFGIVSVGTTHFVLNHTTRRWIPIASTALKPQMRVTLGTPSLNDIAELRKRPDCIQSKDGSLFLQQEGYLIHVRYTPDFDAGIPERLRLPHVR